MTQLLFFSFCLACMLFIIISADPHLPINFSNSLNSSSNGTSFMDFSLILQLDEHEHSTFFNETYYSYQY